MSKIVSKGLEAVTNLMQAYMERSVEKTLEYVTEDIHWTGTGADEIAHSKKSLEKILKIDMVNAPMPFKWQFIEIEEIEQGPLSSVIDGKLKAIDKSDTMLIMEMRISLATRKEGEGHKVCMLHASVPNVLQEEGEFFPISFAEKELEKKLAAERQKSEKQNNAILDLYARMPCGFIWYTIGPNPQIRYCNEKTASVLGYQSKAAMIKSGKFNLMDYVHPDDWEALISKHQRRRLDGANAEIQLTLRVGSGEGFYRWIRGTSKATLALSGNWLMHFIYVDITEEMQAKEDLEMAKRRYDIAMANSDYYVWEYDIKNHCCIQSDKTAGAYGIKETVAEAPEYFIENNLICPESFEAYRRIHREVEAGAEKATAEVRYPRAEGGTMWQFLTYTTIFDERGNPDRAVAVSKDITEQKRLEERYKNELSYNDGAQQNALISYRINLTQNTVEDCVCNHLAMEELIHYKKATELVDDILDQICYEDDRIRVGKVLNLKHLLESYYLGKNEEIVVYERLVGERHLFLQVCVRMIEIPSSGQVMAFVYTSDITEAHMLDSIINQVVKSDYENLMVMNAQTGTIEFTLNNKHNKIPKIEAGNYEKLMPQLLEKLIVSEEIQSSNEKMALNNIRKMLQEKDAFICTYTIINPETGRHERKKWQYNYLGERQDRILLTRSDVTLIYEEEQRKNEILSSALTAAKQANAAKSEFFSRMSHEIRTPMNAIIGMSTIAVQSLKDEKQVADCLSKIGISSRFLLSLINDILDMSRIESGQMLLKNEEIPFEEFVNGINALCYTQAESKNIDYDCIVAPDLDDYYIGDAMKLQQVLVNILANAVKFTPEGGRVTFSVRPVKREKNYSVLRFVVTDTGCGISEAFLPQLFEPFSQEYSGTTSMYSGTGLGLAISKNIVDMMDGNLEVRSIKDIGTEFTIDVRLGLSDEARIRRSRKQVHHFADLKTLVVDDDVAICETTIMTLKEIGVKAEWVDSGKKAVEKVRQKWLEKKYFDMILVDWKMPEMDGIETARQIRKIVGPDVTIIIMTAYDWIAIEHEAKLAGVNLLVSKPMFKSSIVSAFEKVLGMKAEESKALEAEEVDFTGKRILLAEDHPLNVEVAKRLLERRGFFVEHAENGLRALEMFTTAKAGYYDAILMDIRMPLMDGLQAANNIRHLEKEDAKTIPIIAMTANAFDEDRENSRKAGMNAHLAKPVEPKKLFEMLKTLLIH